MTLTYTSQDFHFMLFTHIDTTDNQSDMSFGSQKKLKDAFASKMRLLKKHNNEQERNRFSTLALPEKSNSPDYEFCESDWEIV